MNNNRQSSIFEMMDRAETPDEMQLKYFQMSIEKKKKQKRKQGSTRARKEDPWAKDNRMTANKDFEWH